MLLRCTPTVGRWWRCKYHTSVNIEARLACEYTTRVSVVRLDLTTTVLYDGCACATVACRAALNMSCRRTWQAVRGGRRSDNAIHSNDWHVLVHALIHI